MSNIYFLTNFARWAKYHFKYDETFPKTFDEQLRHVLELDGYDFTHHTNKEIAMFLLRRIEKVEEGWASPYSIFKEIDSMLIFKFGYPKYKPFDMYDALIHYIKSNIAVSDASLFHPSLKDTFK